MRFLKYVFLSVFSLSALVAASTSFSQIPDRINYQGRLTDAGGSPINTTVAITFALYTVQSGGTNIWSETHSSVEVVNGIFEVELGSQGGPGVPADQFDVPLYLGVTVGNDSEMTPRQPLLPAPYAFRSQQAASVDDGTITGASILPGSVGTTSIADGAITAAKVDGSEIITKAGGNITDNDLTITDNNFVLQGTAKIMPGTAGIEFTDGSVLTSVGSRTVQVDCSSESLQDRLNNLGPGGSVTVEINGICNESINVRRSRVEIRGNDGVGDGITGDGINPAVRVDRPNQVWLVDLTIDGNGQDAIRALRNASVLLYNDNGQTVLTGGGRGARVEHGAHISMFGTQANGNSRGSVLVMDGASALLDSVNFVENLDPNPNFDAVVSVGKAGSVLIWGNSTNIQNTFAGASLGSVLDIWQNSYLRLDEATTIAGQIYVTQGSTASIRNSPATITGAIGVFENSVADLRNINLVPNTNVNPPPPTISLNHNSGLRVRNGSTISVDDVFVNRGSYLIFDGGTTLACQQADCPMRVAYGSRLNLGTAFTGDLEIRYDSILELSAAITNVAGDRLEIGEGSSLHMHSGAQVNGDVNCYQRCQLNGWNGQITGTVGVWTNSSFYFSNQMSLDGGVGGWIQAGFGSELRMQNGVAYGTGVTPVWPGGPVIFTERGTVVSIESNVAITGTVEADEYVTMNIDQGAAISGDLRIGSSSVEVSDNVTVGGDLSISDRSRFSVQGGATFQHAGNTWVQNSSYFAVSNDATVDLTTQNIWLNGNSRIELHQNSTVQRALTSDSAISAGQFSTVEIHDGATVTGIVDLGNMASLNSGAATFNGDLNLNSGPQSSANFWSAPNFTSGHGINCWNDANGYLLGQTPTFNFGPPQAGDIDPNCTDQTLP